MKVLVTGSTGFIGIKLALFLAEAGYTVHALYRSESKIKHLNHKNIRPKKGNILDKKSIENAMEGCEYVFHLAGYARVWHKDSDMFHKINYTGTKHVLDAAKKYGVKKTVVTSTAGALGPSINGTITEKSPPPRHFFTDYERTKANAEKLTRHYAKKGLHVVVVNPTRVFGPGLLSDSNSVTKLISMFIRGKFRFLPGNGKSIGNYVFIDDVVKGLVLALEKGKSGERYILGGGNASYRTFFQTIRKVSGKTYSCFPFPLFLMLFVSNIMALSARWFKTEPLITPGWVKKYNYDWKTSSEKAKKQLGYSITPLETGIRKTIEWLQREK